MAFETQRLNEDYPQLAAYASPLPMPDREIIGRELEERQVLASMARPLLSNIVLLAEAGTGKALRNGTLIPVNDSRGYTVIEELEVGDQIFSAEGRVSRVVGVFPQGRKRGYRVLFSGGSYVDCCDEHLWNVRTSAGDGYLTLQLRQIIDTGLYDENDQPLFSIPMSGSVNRTDTEAIYDPFRHGEHVSQNPNARIRNEYMFGSTAQRNEVLRGLLQTNGSLVTGNAGQTQYQVQVFAEDQANDVCELMHSLGLVTEVVADTLENVFVVVGSCVERKIIGVIDLEDDFEMTCIKVDDESELFVVGRDYVLTHNTALVQSVAQHDASRQYLEVDLARMIAETSLEAMPAALKGMFDDAEKFAKIEVDEHGRSIELVMFIDEFHQIVQMSPASVEALKPILAASGTRGIRVIAATTNAEYDQYIKPNQPLMERMDKLSLAPPDRSMVVRILKGMAKTYGVADQFLDDRLYELIYEYTQRYIPASSQPRKSIKILDSMVGWHRAEDVDINYQLLVHVLEESQNVNIAFQVDAPSIKEQLDSVVFSQDNATSIVANRLQICVADLHDKSKPLASFILTGPTGSGKACDSNVQVPVYSADGSVFWKKHGDLVVGDYVFGRDGRPTKVLGNFPQGVKDIYRVSFTDGRTLDVVGEHLWGIYTAKQRTDAYRGKAIEPMVLTTEELLHSGVVEQGDSKNHSKFFVPAGGAVQWPEAELDLNPWVLGVFIGSDGFCSKSLTSSSGDRDLVDRVSKILGVDADKLLSAKDDWTFINSDLPESLINVYSADQRIPKNYLNASVKQRWKLVQGLFDVGGTVDLNDCRNISYSTSSEGLAKDIQKLLYSLGISNHLSVHEDDKHLVEYCIHVNVDNESKPQFFWSPRKKRLVEEVISTSFSQMQSKQFDMVGIVSIEKLPEQAEANCIYVEDAEHLYQSGEGFIVTHNTELTKQLARLLFGDDNRHMIRFDMSEYSQASSVERLRDRLAQQMWHMSHAVLLLDEIEKAHADAIRLLLQVLDDGRLSDANGRTVSFLNSYIVLTTNLGSEIYQSISQYNPNDVGSADAMKEYEEIIRKSLTTGDNKGGFPPELLGRVDAIVPFQPLSRLTLRKVTMVQLRRLVEDVRSVHGTKLQIDRRVVQYLVEDHAKTDASAGGARRIKSKLDADVKVAVAAFINAFPNEKNLVVTIEGEMTSDSKTRLKSEAYVKVSAVR